MVGRGAPAWARPAPTRGGTRPCGGAAQPAGMARRGRSSRSGGATAAGRRARNLRRPEGTVRARRGPDPGPPPPPRPPPARAGLPALGRTHAPKRAGGGGRGGQGGGLGAGRGLQGALRPHPRSRPASRRRQEGNGAEVVSARRARPRPPWCVPAGPCGVLAPTPRALPCAPRPTTQEHPLPAASQRPPPAPAPAAPASATPSRRPRRLASLQEPSAAPHRLLACRCLAGSLGAPPEVALRRQPPPPPHGPPAPLAAGARLSAPRSSDRPAADWGPRRPAPSPGARRAPAPRLCLPAPLAPGCLLSCLDKDIKFHVTRDCEAQAQPSPADTSVPKAGAAATLGPPTEFARLAGAGGAAPPPCTGPGAPEAHPHPSPCCPTSLPGLSLGNLAPGPGSWAGLDPACPCPRPPSPPPQCPVVGGGQEAAASPGQTQAAPDRLRLSASARTPRSVAPGLRPAQAATTVTPRALHGQPEDPAPCRRAPAERWPPASGRSPGRQQDGEPDPTHLTPGQASIQLPPPLWGLATCPSRSPSPLAVTRTDCGSLTLPGSPPDTEQLHTSGSCSMNCVLVLKLLEGDGS
uniref:basic proline-rich protein-like n=1 Tax=Nyctereutes procyonoides TaxID=34880 RepID=UPI002443C8ED|nr:basic proline-rich protein-like [Nyctereutes procyonoides]XP_055189533.1 basic proline-rich protein-like [Nyctereutes procyonoides]